MFVRVAGAVVVAVSLQLRPLIHMLELRPLRSRLEWQGALETALVLLLIIQEEEEEAVGMRA
jgi:hypothetical protein